MATDEQEREAFEKWAKQNFVSAPPGLLDFNERHWRLMWDAWQARAALSSPPPQEAQEPVLRVHIHKHAPTPGRIDAVDVLRPLPEGAHLLYASTPSQAVELSDEQIEALLPEPDLENEPIELWGQNARDDFWNRTSIRKIVRAALAAAAKGRP